MSRLAVSDDDLRLALIRLKKEKPHLGVSKIHGLLLEANPTWSVSEKRVRKVLQTRAYPSSSLNKSLDIDKWSKKIQVQYFDAVRGKGLVATEKISEGEVIWKEDPFILAPEWYVDRCW